jgi:hypothetical protein
VGGLPCISRDKQEVGEPDGEDADRLERELRMGKDLVGEFGGARLGAQLVQVLTRVVLLLVNIDQALRDARTSRRQPPNG